MTSLQRFFSAATAAMFVLAAGESVYAQSHWWQVEIREGNNNYTVMVLVNLEEFSSTEPGSPNTAPCSNPSHRTINGNKPFWHIHVQNRPFPIDGYVIGAGTLIPKQVTAANIKARWDYEMPRTDHGKEAIEIIYEGGENITYNCWAYAMGYPDIWIQDPTPIYDYDYYTTSGPAWRENVIRLKDKTGKDCHVLTIADFDYAETNYLFGLVVETREKNRHSGQYFMRYSPTTGICYSSDMYYYRRP